MNFSRLQSNPSTLSPAGTDAKVAAAPVKPTVAATPPAPTQAVAVQEQSRSLSLFGGGTNTDTLLAVVGGGEGGGKLAFPTLQVKGGAAGSGLFAPVKNSGAPEILDLLPQGTRPVRGLFLAHRTIITAWPTGYDENAEEHAQPAWDCAATTRDDISLVKMACKAYQFTSRDDKGKFDVAAGGPGHVRPTFQLLVYLPDIDGCIVVEPPASYSSWVYTMESLIKLATKDGLGNFPCKLTIVTGQEKSRKTGRSWAVHHIDCGVEMEHAQKIMDAAIQWREKVSQSPQDMQVISDWISGLDRPVSEDARKAMRLAGSWGR